MAVPPVHYVLTDPTSFTIIFPWGAEVHDKKTGEVKKRVPEMGIPTLRQFTALSDVIQVLNSTPEIKGVEVLRLEAAKLLGTLLERVTQEIQTAKPAIQAA